MVFVFLWPPVVLGGHSGTTWSLTPCRVYYDNNANIKTNYLQLSTVHCPRRCQDGRLNFWYTVRDEPAELPQASGQNVPRTSPWGGVSGRSIWTTPEARPGQAGDYVSIWWVRGRSLENHPPRFSAETLVPRQRERTRRAKTNLHYYFRIIARLNSRDF